MGVQEGNNGGRGKERRKQYATAVPSTPVQALLEYGRMHLGSRESFGSTDTC
jgi:hypothetical protein